MKIKVWYCFGSHCIKPCIFPYVKGYDAPDECSWGGLSYFKYKEIDVNELLSYFVEIGKYASVAFRCEANKGICHKEGKCSENCSYADKYEETKNLFERARECENLDNGFCKKNNKECVVSDCDSLLK